VGGRRTCSDVKKEGFCVNLLSITLAKTEFYKEVHRWTQEKVWEPGKSWPSKESLSILPKLNEFYNMLYNYSL
jgi:hypothetical protein